MLRKGQLRADPDRRGMKVRVYVSMVEMMRRSQLDEPQPNRKQVVSSVNDGADELKIRTYVWGDELKE